MKRSFFYDEVPPQRRLGPYFMCQHSGRLIDLPSIGGSVSKCGLFQLEVRLTNFCRIRLFIHDPWYSSGTFLVYM